MDAPPPYEEAIKTEIEKSNCFYDYVKPTLVQPASGRFVHEIPDEIQPGIPTRQFIVIDRCPACGFGVLEDGFSCAGICCAVLLFPVGILCCLASREKQCSRCMAKYPY